jgi:hypothetical protein
VLVVVVVGAVVASMVICLIRDAKSRVIAVAILLFPFLYAASPATAYWADGRYIVYLGPFLVLVLAVASEELPHLRPVLRTGGWRRLLPRTPRPGFVGALIVALGLVSVGFHQVASQTPSSFFRAWVNPDTPAQQTVDALVAHGITRGYANYWIAYKLDFMGGKEVQITTAGDDADRSHVIDLAVARAPHPAWLFVPASQMQKAENQFSSTLGPGGQSQSSFDESLLTQHIGYRVVDAGLVVAVIPDKPVKVVHTGLRSYG